MFSVSAVTDRTFTTTRLGEGYELAEVDQYRTEVVALFTALDSAIDELNADLAATRVRLAQAEADRGHRVETRSDTAAAAGRLLETAALTADQLVADANAEAESLLRAARGEAECVTAEVARHTEQQTAELEEYRSRVLTEVADTKAALEAQIEALRQLERGQRNHLRRYFAECLAQLDEAAAPAMLHAVAE